LGRKKLLPKEILRLRLARIEEDRPKDVLEILFHTGHARKVAQVFLEQMVAHGERMTTSEMGAFVRSLESGAFSVRMASGAFYGKGGIPRVLQDLGLLNIELRHVDHGKDLVLCYTIVNQSLGRQPPEAPIMLNAWTVGDMWNTKIDQLREAARSKLVAPTTA